MNSRGARSIVFSVLVLFVLSSCSSAPSSGGPAADAGGVVKLQGAGASFPAPLYTKWFKTYSSAHQNVQIDYQSVGSGSGVKSVIDKTVDFGASDAAMKPEDMQKVERSAYRPGESGIETAGPADQCRRSCRQQRHNFRVHETSQRDQ